MESQTGFGALQTPMGMFLLAFALFVFTTTIIVGARLVKLKEASDRELRAKLRQEVEARKKSGLG